MQPTKALGPDGMPALFFQHFWDIIGNDVCAYILHILNNNGDPRPINHTSIYLILKVTSPVLCSKYRPISLCDVIFKIITKVLANRLKFILPNIISNNQSAVLRGRLITDNALIAFELFHRMKIRKRVKNSFMGFKFDMSKA